MLLCLSLLIFQKHAGNGWVIRLRNLEIIDFRLLVSLSDSHGRQTVVYQKMLPRWGLFN